MIKESFYDWCIKNNRQDLLDRWDYDLNNLVPKQVSSCSIKQYYFKCPKCLHNSELYILHNITRRENTATLCNQCNSFAQHLIDLYGNNALEQYWDYERNNISPWDINYGSKNTIYIKCQNVDYHNSYDTTPKDFCRGRRCPYCSGKRVHPLDSFANFCNQKYGEGYIDKIWDYNKNTVDPWNIRPRSNIYVYLKCPFNKHPSSRVLLSNFDNIKYHCSYCAQEHLDSTLQITVSQYIQETYLYNIFHEFDCSIKLKNPKTNRWLRYDNEIIIENGTRLIIEVHGMQHYIADCGYNNKRAKKLHITVDEVLQEQQYRDSLKQQYALSQGYHYLVIPYWTEDDESYKQLIDDKIQSIINTPK